jgi:hypothetical protein
MRIVTEHPVKIADRTIIVYFLISIRIGLDWIWVRGLQRGGDVMPISTDLVQDSKKTSAYITQAEVFSFATNKV